LCDLFEVVMQEWSLTPRHPRKLGWRGVSCVWPLRGHPATGETLEEGQFRAQPV